MIEAILGSVNKERILLFILARDEGYARQIASFFNTGLNPIQKQLERLEFNRILYSKSVGRTRLYKFNTQYPFLNELKQILEKAFSFYPEEERDKLLLVRKRPRRARKPL